MGVIRSNERTKITSHFQRTRLWLLDCHQMQDFQDFLFSRLKSTNTHLLKEKVTKEKENQNTELLKILQYFKQLMLFSFRSFWLPFQSIFQQSVCGLINIRKRASPLVFRVICQRMNKTSTVLHATKWVLLRL